MKTTYSIAMAGCALLAWAPLGGAQTDSDPFAGAPGEGGESDHRPKLIRVQVELIETSHEMLTALMSDEEVANDTQLRGRLTQLIGKKEAKVFETMMVVTRPGQKATAESIEEYIYPTEYEPAEIPNEVTVTEGGSREVNARDLATGPTPTAFETRNLGATLEVEPHLGDDERIIDLRFSPEVVSHVRNEVWAEWSGRHGRSDIQMPVIFSMRCNTAVSVVDGSYCMVAVQSPKGEDGYPDFDRKIMMFVRCDVMTVAP